YAPVVVGFTGPWAGRGIRGRVIIGGEVQVASDVNHGGYPVVLQGREQRSRRLRDTHELLGVLVVAHQGGGLAIRRPCLRSVQKGVLDGADEERQFLVVLGIQEGRSIERSVPRADQSLGLHHGALTTGQPSHRVRDHVHLIVVLPR